MLVSYLDFPATKRGYRSYLKAKGYEYDGVNSPMMEITLSKFKSREETLSQLEDRLEKLTDSWTRLVEQGQDSYDVESDAYHCRVNHGKLVRKIDSLTKECV